MSNLNVFRLLALAALTLWLAGCGATPPPPAATPDHADSAPGPTDPDARERTVGFGEEIDLASHIPADKLVIVDFYSDFCPPCKAIAPKLAELVQRDDRVAVLKVDINRPDVRGIDWQSPVARQFNLRSIPHFQIWENGSLSLDDAQDGQPARAKLLSLLSEAGID